MMIFSHINPEFQHLKNEIQALPERFKNEGEVLEKDRNVIKIISVDGIPMNVKSFKIPNPINRLAYAYVRPSKAERSYKYAELLLKRGIGTPKPIAYIICKNLLGISHSYYISLQQEHDFLFRDLKLQNPPEMEQILREFTRFTHHFHTQGIYFIDHSPGNTLIKKTGQHYDFYLVDLNRIKFMPIDPLTGLKNFYRLNATDTMIDIIADEYAHLTSSDAQEMTRLLKAWTHAHDAKVLERKRKKGIIKG